MIQAVHYINPQNAGDMQSCPFEHFSVNTEIRKVHIMDTHRLDPKVPVIIGGGGLLQHGQSIDNIESIINTHRAPIIIWGAGVNTNHRKDRDIIPDFIHKACMVGIRDYGFPGFDYLPCVSCMHPAFDKKYAIKNEIVCFEGNKLNLPYPTMTCQEGATIEQVIEFLGSSKTIVTSSYHGMYWGVLLGKEVIVIPNEGSSKFYNFPLNIPITTLDNWKFFIGKAEIHDTALERFRAANKKYAEQVSYQLNIEFINKNAV